jgi:hypothetical protein
MATNARKVCAQRASQLPSRRKRRSRSTVVAQPVAPRPYDRRTELPHVLPLWPHELEDETPEGRWRILGKLRSALRAERRRGVAGHWTYDLARHVELLRVYRLELAASRTTPVIPEAEPQARLSGTSCSEPNLTRSRLGAPLAFRSHRPRNPWPG